MSVRNVFSNAFKNTPLTEVLFFHIRNLEIDSQVLVQQLSKVFEKPDSFIFALCYLSILSFHRHDCKMVHSSRHPTHTQDRKSGEGLAPARSVQFIREAEHGRSSLAVFLFAQIWTTSHSYKEGGGGLKMSV